MPPPSTHIKGMLVQMYESLLLGFASGEEIGEKGCIVFGLMPLSINSSLERSGWYLLM